MPIAVVPSLICILLGGGLIFAADAPPQSHSAGFATEAARFIDSEMQLFPEHATHAGDHRFDGRLTDLSKAGIDAAIHHARRWRERFNRFSAASLSAHDEADREWLLNNLDSELLDRTVIRSYARDPGAYLPTAAIYPLIQRDFAPLAVRMRAVTARETDALANLEAARRNLEPSLTSRVAIDIELEQMPGTIDFFRRDLPTAFATVPDGPAKANFRKANAKLLAAIEAYREWLTRMRKKTFGSYAIGNAAFARLVADEMVDIPVARLEAIGVAELARLQKKFTATANQIDPHKPPDQVFRELSSVHPQPAEIIPAVAGGLSELRGFVVKHHLAAIPPSDPPAVIETPPFFRATVFAAIDTPGPLEKNTQSYFYVTLPDPSWPPERAAQLLEFFAPPTISDTSVHEVYPGHYVQLLVNRQNSDPVRALYESGAYVEGWALYCEQMMLDEGLHGDAPAYRLAQIQMALLRACRYLAAIRMHTRGMTVEQATAFFERNAYMPHGNARMEALRGTGDPSYFIYQLGKLMILKLRADVKARQGASFDLGRFHDTFLHQGAMPLKLIRRAMLGTDGPLL